MQLGDGRWVRFRPIQPEDSGRLRRFHRRLSPESQRLRFFSPLRELSQRMADNFTHVDFERRAAVVVVHPDDDELRGVGRLEMNLDGTAEVAFVLEDSLQGLGLGKHLLRLLARFALAHGVTRFKAMVLPENHAMLGMFRSSGYPVRFVVSDGVMVVTIELATEREAVPA